VDTPDIINPADGFLARTGDPVLVWTAETGATEYNVEVSEDATFVVGVTRFTVNEPQAQRGFPFGATYHWRVRAYATGDVSSYSTSRSFVVPDSLPAADAIHNSEGRSYLLGQFKEGS
jgi:hypothetical protein